jgi:hypothetical protein
MDFILGTMQSGSCYESERSCSAVRFLLFVTLVEMIWLQQVSLGQVALFRYY